MSGGGGQAVTARTTAHLLAATGRPLGATGLVLLAVAFAALALTDPARPGLVWTSALTGVVAVERAVQVRFDAALFDDLARAGSGDLAPLDVALATLFPGRAAPTGRSLEARVQGARRLALTQAAVVAAQAALLLAAFAPV